MTGDHLDRLRRPAVDQALCEALGVALSGLGRGHECPPLFWSLRGSDTAQPGQLSGMAAPYRFTRHAAVQGLARWAELLGLAACNDPHVPVCYRGQVDCHPIEIWWLPPLVRRSAVTP